MGWLGYPLPAFHMKKPHKRKPIQIGIPGPEFGSPGILPGWETPIAEHFEEPGHFAMLEYDFGDGWSHHVLLEDILLKAKWEFEALLPLVLRTGRAALKKYTRHSDQQLITGPDPDTMFLLVRCRKDPSTQ